MGWKQLPLRVSSALLSAGVTASESVGGALLLLRLVNRYKALTACEQAHHVVDEVLFRLWQGRLPKILPTFGQGHRVQVVDPSGRVVAASRSLYGSPRIASFAPDPGWVSAGRTLHSPSFPGGRMSVLAMRVSPEMHRRRYGRDPLLVYVALPAFPWYGSKRWAVATTVAAVLATVAAGLAAYRSTAKALTPVERIRREFTDITATDLNRRVTVPEHQEFKALAQALNDTLGRLQDAVSDLRLLSAGASHDLRSPLTGIRTRLEDALMHPEDVDWPETATAVLSAVERQQAIVADLHELTRLETGQPLHLQRTDLADLVDSELRARHADRIPVNANLIRGVTIDCDRLLICRLLTNLLDNAERHAATAVNINVNTLGPDAILEVCNDGEGIPPDQSEKIFESFVRLKDSRDKDPLGTGLGLAISRRIARSHHGSLVIENHEHHPHRTCFVLRLPRAAGLEPNPEVEGTSGAQCP